MPCSSNGRAALLHGADGSSILSRGTRFSLGSLMVEFMVWDHMTSVRFTLERPTTCTGGGEAQRTRLQI